MLNISQGIENMVVQKYGDLLKYSLLTYDRLRKYGDFSENSQFSYLRKNKSPKVLYYSTLCYYSTNNVRRTQCTLFSKYYTIESLLFVNMEIGG